MTTTLNHRTDPNAPAFPADWKAPTTCPDCKGELVMTGDGTDTDNGGDQRIKNLLGINVQANRWRVFRCVQCFVVKLYRLPG